MNSLKDKLQNNPGVIFEHQCERSSCVFRLVYENDQIQFQDVCNPRHWIPGLPICWKDLDFTPMKSDIINVIDPVKTLFDNPDVVYTYKNDKSLLFRCHDYTLQYKPIDFGDWTSWLTQKYSIRSFRDRTTYLGGLVPYSSQEILKEKLEKVKLPYGYELKFENKNWYLVAQPGIYYRFGNKEYVENQISIIEKRLELYKTLFNLNNIVNEHKN